MAGVAQLSRIHIEPIGGLAGDMLLAALLDLGGDRRALEAVFASVAHLNGEQPIRLRSARVELAAHGAGPRVAGTAPLIDAIQIAAHPPSSATGHSHHRHVEHVFALLESSSASPAAIDAAQDTFRLLCAAEATAHQTTADQVHLHEVGELDSIMDVLGFHVLHHSLGSPALSCASLPSGSGSVDTSHGRLECPVPAVRALVDTHHLPLHSVEVVGETLTPTGVALVARASFPGQMPQNPADRVGVGAGTKRFAQRANIVRLHGWH